MIGGGGAAAAEVRDIFHAGEGSLGGPGCPRTALTITSSRRAVPRRCVREGFRGPDLEILGTGSWTLGGRRGGNRQWVRTCASGTGVRAGHRRSGDPGLWVRNKEHVG
jgi:hypothetical protein